MTAVEQCGNTELHEPHAACAGLSEYDVIVRVGCPDCMAPPAAPCRFSAAPRDGADSWPTTAVHGSRRDLAFTERGTCQLCSLLLLHDKRTGRVWHPEVITTACPPLPDPATRWNDYAAAIKAGAVPGEPGADNFVPDAGEQPIDTGTLSIESPVSLSSRVRVICPECAAGKCINCVGEALHPVTDQIVVCECVH